MFPVTINEPGSYYLTGNVSTTGSGIIIQTPDVTIDLMGFTLEGGTGPGIDGSNYDRVSLRNGRIQGWSGTGVRLRNRAVLQDLIVRDNRGSGVDIGYDARVVSCTVEWNDVHGVIVASGSLVKDSLASNNRENGIWVTVPTVSHGALLTGCVVDSNGRNGIRADGRVSVLGNHVRSNDHDGDNGKAGIWLTGPYNRVEGNTVLQNNIGVDIEGNNNVVVRNVVGNNLVRNFDEEATATGNYVPVWTVGTSGSPEPWANIEQP
jgi:hypothetical protein